MHDREPKQAKAYTTQRARQAYHRTSRGHPREHTVNFA